MNSNSLFVSTLPYSSTNQNIVDFFSQIGPLKSSFVIMKDGKHSGCGIVSYALKEDAAKAKADLKKIKFMGVRTLKIAFAKKRVVDGEAPERKPKTIKVENKSTTGYETTTKTAADDDSNELKLEGKQRKEKKGKLSEEVETVEELTEKEETATVPEDDDVVLVDELLDQEDDASSEIVPTPIEHLRFNPQRQIPTLHISQLPKDVTQKQLYKKLRKFGEPSITFPLGSDSTQAQVIYNSVDEANNAFVHLHEHVFKGEKLMCTLHAPKQCRLIVRNLPFAAKVGHLNALFEPFGQLVDVNLPLKDGKPRGFAFVQFALLDHARRAIESVNGTKVLNRMVAVDWALGKLQYDKIQEKEAAETTEEIVTNDVEMEVNDDANTTNVAPQQVDGILQFKQVEDEEKSVGLESNEESESEEEQDPDDFIEIEHSESDDSDAESIEVINEYSPVQEEEDTTLFIRNLSFNTTEETLHDAFSKFGHLHYAKITKDKITLQSRGTGFIKYHKKDDADLCIKSYTDTPPQASLDSPFMIDERFVSVDVAVSKTVATSLSNASKVNSKLLDKRNTYLLREGVLFPESDGAVKADPELVVRSMDSYANRKRLLATNPNLFVSKTRLSIRGVPTAITDAELKTEAKYAVIHFHRAVANGTRQGLEADESAGSTGGKIVIIQSKLLRSDRIDPLSKKPRSKGMGFVEFSNHADALACLRYLNLNPLAFTHTKLPVGNKPEVVTSISATEKKRKQCIVEFAVENKLVLKRREEMMSKRKRDDGEKPTRVRKDKKAKTEGNTVKEVTETTTIKTEKKSYKERMLLRKSKRTAKKTRISNGESAPVVAPTPPKDKSQVSVSEKTEGKEKKKTKRQQKMVKNLNEEVKFDQMVQDYKDRTLKTVVKSKWYE